MTNDRAVEVLKAIIFLLDKDDYSDEVEEAIHMAINALKAQEVSNDSPELDNNFGDLIRRAAAIDIGRNATVDTNPSHFEAHQKFMQFMDDAEISSFGRWQWSNGFNTALTAVGIDLEKLPSAQPETHEERTETHACDCISRKEAIDAFDNLEWFHQNANKDMVSGANSAEHQAWYKADDVYRVLDEVYAHAETEAEARFHAQQRWIPCSERLPEDIRPVIVTWKNTDPASYYQYIVGKHFTGTACYKNGKWYWYSSTTEDMLAEYGRYDSEEFDEAIECVAWMPLPEPYAERRTDED